MRVGIDCRHILHPDGGEGAGVGHYVHHLVTALLAEPDRNEYVLFFDNHDVAEAKREVVGGDSRVTVRVLPFRSFRRAMPFVYSHMVVASVFERERLDVLHGPANVVPLFYRRPWVVTVHDVAIYDHPEWFPAGSLGGQSFSKGILVPHSLRHAERVIAVSQTTKHDVMRIFGLHSRKIDVIYEGAAFHPGNVDVPSVLRRHGLVEGEYALYLGTIEPRKNIAIAVNAFVHAAKRGWVPEHATFAIAGARGWKERPVFDAIVRANAELGRERVRYLGYLPHGEKHAVLSSAATFVFPSLYEGFGLPVIEAMSVGVPVIASDTAALAEVCGDAAMLVAPYDEEGFSHAFRRVWNDDAVVGGLRRLGMERGRSFDWRRTARQTLETYARAVAARPSANSHGVA